MLRAIYFFGCKCQCWWKSTNYTQFHFNHFPGGKYFYELTKLSMVLLKLASNYLSWLKKE